MSIKRENSAPIFTDTWNSGGDREEIPEGELFQGEISAVFFRIGCYTVRSALRVYKVRSPEGKRERIPANPAEVEGVRKDNNIVGSSGKLNEKKDVICPETENLQ